MSDKQIICPQCGTSIPKTAFCPLCGTPIEFAPVTLGPTELNILLTISKILENVDVGFTDISTIHEQINKIAGTNLNRETVRVHVYKLYKKQLLFRPLRGQYGPTKLGNQTITFYLRNTTDNEVPAENWHLKFRSNASAHYDQFF